MTRPQVASLRFVLISVRFVAGLRRSLRLQYVKKSVNNPSTFAGECTPAPPPYLVSQVRSGVHCHICSWVRCRVHFGSRTRLRSRGCSRVIGENIIVRRNSGFENCPNCGGLQSFSDVRNQQRTEHIQRPAWAVNVPFTCTFYEKEGARASCQHVNLRNCGGLPASTTTLKNANDCKTSSSIHIVGTPTVTTMAPPPWHATPDGQWRAKRILAGRRNAATDWARRSPRCSLWRS